MTLMPRCESRQSVGICYGYHRGSPLSSSCGGRRSWSEFPMGRHLRRGSAKPGAAASKSGIRELVAQHLPKCKVPRRVVFQAALPKNWTVKVQQRPLREEFASPRAA